MLLALLFMLLMGPGGSEGRVVDVSTSVKEQVADPGKRKEILGILKKIQAEDLQSAKEVAAARAALVRLNRDRLCASEEMLAVYSDLDAKRSRSLQAILEERFRMKRLMTEEEWQRVHAADAEDR